MRTWWVYRGATRMRRGAPNAAGWSAMSAPPCTQESAMVEQGEHSQVDFRTEPARYRHWRLAFDGPVATLAMNVQEDGGLRPGYELKLNSYDLGVDIELYDA